MNGRKFGFTLIEMLIIVVTCILLLIVLPRWLGIGRAAKEAELRGDLHQLRNAIQQFEADCGDYPIGLTDLYEGPGPGTVGGRGIALDVKKWQGPYLSKLPKDPFTLEVNWKYDHATGNVHSSSPLTSTKGESYSSW